jgi:hypothetical protein
MTTIHFLLSQPPSKEVGHLQASQSKSTNKPSFCLPIIFNVQCLASAISKITKSKVMPIFALDYKCFLMTRQIRGMLSFQYF